MTGKEPKLYACPDCGMEYAKIANLALHILYNHPSNSQEPTGKQP